MRVRNVFRYVFLFLVLCLITNQTYAERFRHDKIYIDSVPRGATVSLLPREGSQGEAVELGKTPLELDPSQVPSMRFVIMMDMEEYIKAVESLPGLDEWVEDFKVGQYTGSSRGGHQNYFIFFDTATSQTVTNLHGALVAVGPEYTLDYPRYHRLVGLFIPRGIKASTFYPLMPPSGTFTLDPQAYGASLIKDYHFSAEQATEAVGALSRCGNYVTKVTVPGVKDTAIIYILSAQKNYFVTQSARIRIIPGYSD